VARVEHAAFGHHDLDGFQAAGVERDLVVDQRAEDVEHRRHRDRARRVEVVGELRAGPGEVDLGAARLGIDAHLHADHRAVVERQRELAVAQCGDHTPHRLFGVVLHMGHVGRHRLAAVLRHHRTQFLHALLVGGDLRAQVGEVLLRVA
jgi:hypothetical protein